MANFNVAFFLFFSLFVGHGVEELQASHHDFSHLQTVKSSVSAKQPYRTGYHFQPPKNWINGVMIYKGVYHLFYQYNPNGVVWDSNIVWAHSTSKDLVNWTPHEPAIYPSQTSDINGCWSGSATILSSGKPIQQTAWLGPDKKWRVILGSKVNSQALAIVFKSKDFVNWVQSKTPLHSANTGMWECPDFYPVPVKGQNAVDTSVNSPYVKHVLKTSLEETKHDLYTVGSYDNVKDVYTPDEGSVEGDSGLRYDYGKYYASKTFFDNVKNRRILTGWSNESSSEADDIKKGWSGVHAIPRKIWLARSGKQLVQWPVTEIQKLRENQVNLTNKTVKGGSVIEVSGITAAQADVDVSFEIADIEKAEVLKPSWTNPQLLCSQKGASVKGRLGPFGLLVLASDGLKENTAVFFRIFKSHNKYVVLMCSDQSRSSLNQDNDKTTYGAFLDVDIQHQKLSLRSLIDHSIVESFGGGGKVCITSRVYPTLAIDKAAHLYAFNNGTQSIKIAELNAWSMNTAKIN
ncbi:hypothetical protein GQ457_14G006960 [Hibiscus cannabinus]